MKKFFLLSALALGAMTMSAELTQIGTFSGELNHLAYAYELYYHNYPQSSQYANVIDTTGSNIKVNLIDLATCSIYKTVQITKVSGRRYHLVGGTVKNFWTNDGKLAFALSSYKQDGGEENTIIYNEDAEQLCTFSTDLFCIVDGGELYYVVDVNYKTKVNTVYSCPKYHTPSNIEEPTAPARTSNARKVVENGQMYIILDGVKYAVTGSTAL